MQTILKPILALALLAGLALMIIGCAAPEPADTSMIVDKSQAPADTSGSSEPSRPTEVQTNQSSEGS